MPAALRPLLVTNDFPPQVGGIQQFADHIARRLPRAAVFAADHADAASHDATAPYPVIRGPARYLWPTRRVEAALRGAVGTTDANLLLFATPWPLVDLGARVGLPTVVCVHGAELILATRIPGVREKLRASLRRAELLLSVSDHTARHLRALVGTDGPPIRLLRNGVDLAAFEHIDDPAGIRARHGLGDDPTVVCVGRLVRRKGQDVLVEAWPQVRSALPDARLVLVGDGPLRSTLRRAAAQLPDGAVTLTGRVAAADLPRYLAAADVFAHPNRARWFGLETEGFGIVFLEAQAAGRPVIAGDSGGAPEALLVGETGLLVDGTDPGSVAGTVITLLGDPDRAARMGAAGRRFVAERHDWDRIVADLADDLTRVLADEPVPTHH